MNILIVAKKFPYPLNEGEPIAINYLAKSLVALGCSVDLLVLNTSKHFFDPALFPAKENFFEEVHSVPVDNQITLLGALRSFLAGKSYIIDRFKSSEFETKLFDLLRNKRYEVVQLETIYLAHCIPTVRKFAGIILSLRAHNVEHEIWERVASNTQNPLKKWYLRNQNTHLRQFETEKLNEVDVLLGITSRDLAAFRALGFVNEGIVAPVGINLTDYPIENQQVASKTSIAFIGALDWMPNQHGIVWILEKVWPKLRRYYPEAAFHIAGKNMPSWLVSKAWASAKVHGEVLNAKDFIKQHQVLVAPLFSGSGIKIKVLEGMALARTVITTSIGAEGIPAKSGQHLLIADSASEFEKHISWCFENPKQAAEIGMVAREFIRDHFDNLAIANRVKTTYEKLVNI